MTLTFELAQFSVREEDEAALLAERPEMIRAVQRAFPGALAAWLTKQDDGTWLDWFRHISQSGGVRHAEVAHEQLFASLGRPNVLST